MFYDKYLSGNLIGSTASGKSSILNNNIYDGVCPDCNHYEDCALKRKNHKYPDPLISYSINNYGYRSDNIDPEDVSENFLFSGCSYTFGIGLPLESIWAHQINTELGGSKFINLGINSGSYKTIVFDIFTYIRMFGKPKGVFILFPNMERHISFTEDKSLFVRVYRNPQGRDDMQKCLEVIPEDVNMFEFYQTVMMLEDYLMQLDIPLVWTTWDGELNKRIGLTEGFRNYVNLDNFEIFSNTESMKKPEKFNNEYWEKARDFAHPGTKNHIYYAKLLIDAWKGRYEKTNQ